MDGPMNMNDAEYTFEHEGVRYVLRIMYTGRFGTKGIPLTIWEADVTRDGATFRQALLMSSDCDHRIRVADRLAAGDAGVQALVAEGLARGGRLGWSDKDGCACLVVLAPKG